MQTSVKIKLKSTIWSETLRPRVLDTVLKNGSYFTNSTGKNSDPNLLLDWVFTGTDGTQREEVLFKNPSNDPTHKFLEEGDITQRVVENTKIEGIYNGPNQFLLSSYTIYSSIEF